MKVEIKNQGATVTITRVHLWRMAGDGVLLFQVDTKEKRCAPHPSVTPGEMYIQFYKLDQQGNQVPVPDLTVLRIIGDTGPLSDDAATVLMDDDTRYGFLVSVIRDTTQEERDASLTLFEQD